jgi:hypothetical protein
LLLLLLAGVAWRGRPVHLLLLPLLQVALSPCCLLLLLPPVMLLLLPGCGHCIGAGRPQREVVVVKLSAIVDKTH